MKIKKCLLAHPVLSLDSPSGAIWWVCDRWQTSAPPAVDLLLALPFAGTPDPDKLAQVEKRLWEAPVETVPWGAALRNLAKAGRGSALELFDRIDAHLGAGDPALLWNLCASAVELASDDDPELLRRATAAYLRGIASPPDLAPVRNLLDALRNRHWSAEADALTARFPALASQPEPSAAAPSAAPASGPEEAAGAAPSSAPTSEAATDPEVARADEVWAGFEKAEHPGAADVERLVGGLLALPLDKAGWDRAFPRLAKVEGVDALGLYRRLLAGARPSGDGLARLHATAAATLGQLGRPEALVEIVGRFSELDAGSFSVQALGQLAVELLYHDLTAETLELYTRFLPLVPPSQNPDIPGPRELAWRIFQLRIGTRIASPASEVPTLETLAASLREGLAGHVPADAALRAARVLLAPAPESGWARDRLNAWPSFKASREEADRIELVYLGTQVWIVREGLQHEKLAPSVTWLGLEGIRRMLDLETRKKRNRPVNLLDYLDSRHLEARIARACAGPRGTLRSLAVAMVRTLDAAVRFAARRALLPEYQAAPLEERLLELLDRFERMP